MFTGRKEAFMLQQNSRFARNPYFHFHPLQSVFSLIGALVLLFALIWLALVGQH
jgi:hypothetical protein